MLRLAAAVASCAAAGLAQQSPTFFCMYSCEQAPTTRTSCAQMPCTPTPPGCSLIPAPPPFFMSAAECDAFLARKPHCEKGGSCFADDSPPQLPSEWSQGFVLGMSMGAEQWKYGVRSSAAGSELMAVDPAGQNFFDHEYSQQISGLAPQGPSIYASLLQGSTNRFYSFVNDSAFGPPRCYYQTASEEMKRIMMTGATFANFTWSKDSVDYGERVSIFHDATLEVGELVRPGAHSGGEVGQAPPAITISVERVSTKRTLLLNAAQQKPIRMIGGLGVPRAFWGRTAGLQGTSVVGNVTKFVPGKPAASFFEVPKAWGTCREIPTPPPGAVAQPLLRGLGRPSLAMGGLLLPALAPSSPSVAGEKSEPVVV